jgi:adenylosuccinate lyase
MGGETPEMHDSNERWASAALRNLWTDRETTIQRRRLWVAVLRAQLKNGMIATDHDHGDALAAYEAVIGAYNAEHIHDKELQTGHHLQAHLMAFEELAGLSRHGGQFGLLHRGLTSCDIEDLVTQGQILASLGIINEHWAAATERLTNLTDAHRTTPTAARTHGLPAQPYTVGRRLANYLDQTLYTHGRFAQFRRYYPVRVLGGAVGTRSDLTGLAPDEAAIEKLIDTALVAMGPATSHHPVSVATGQTYHRLLDFELAATLTLLTTPYTGLAATLRAMVTLGHATEQPTTDQVGSSAMPHKRNPRYLERIAALHSLLRGHLTTLANSSTGQLFEGDVADSAARRIAIPGALMAADGILCAVITALDRLRFNERAIIDDHHYNLLFISTGWLLAQAVQHNPDADRHALHGRIRHHAADALDMVNRNHPRWAITEYFAKALRADQMLGLTDDDLVAARRSPPLGQAHEQTSSVLSHARILLGSYLTNTRGWTPEKERETL